jgi:hypothetical protein
MDIVPEVPLISIAMITNPRFFQRVGLAGLVLSILFAVSAGAVEMREWTSIKGTKIQATYVRLDGENVILLTKESRELKVAKSQLSKGDQDYLKEIGAKSTGFAPSGPVKPARLVVPAKEVKIDPKTFVKREAPLEVPQVTFTEVLESPHFIVASTGKLRCKDTAENAERLWHEMAFIHPTFGDKWVDKKMAILIATSDEAYDDIGSWYATMVKAERSTEAATQSERIRKAWPQTSGGAVNLDAETADKNKIHRHARVFRITKPELEREFTGGVWVPFRTHTLAGDLLDIQIGGLSSLAKEGGAVLGAFWLETGFCYYKEIQLCGETRTNMVRVVDDASQGEEAVGKAGQFASGKDWAGQVKKYLRQAKTKPSLKVLYLLKNESLKDSDCGLAYAFNYYLQSTPDRVEKYSEVIKRVSTSFQVPAPDELAKMYGFENGEALEADWIAWMGTPAFR